MFRRPRKTLSLIIATCTLLAGCQRGPNPADTVRNAYDWYLRELKSGVNPLEQKRAELKEFVTDGFLTSVGRRIFETARHDNRIRLARARKRHDRGPGSRPANACRSPGGISQYYLDVAGSDYRRCSRNTRRQRCFDWIRSRFNYRSGLELRLTMVAGGRL